MSALIVISGKNKVAHFGSTIIHRLQQLTGHTILPKWFDEREELNKNILAAHYNILLFILSLSLSLCVCVCDVVFGSFVYCYDDYVCTVQSFCIYFFLWRFSGKRKFFISSVFSLLLFFLIRKNKKKNTFTYLFHFRKKGILHTCRDADVEKAERRKVRGIWYVCIL